MVTTMTRLMRSGRTSMGRPVGGRSLLSPLQRAILERQRANASEGRMDAPDARVHAELATVDQRLERDGAAVAA